MCLKIGNKLSCEKQEWEKHMKRYGPYAWKVIRIYEDGSKTSCFDRVDIVFDKWLVSSRRSVKLTRTESTDREVNRGFHVFLTRKDARKFARYRDNNSFTYGDYRYQSIRVEVKDFVVAGIFDTIDKSYPSAVFHKVKYKKK